MLNINKFIEQNEDVKEKFLSFCDLFELQVRANPSAIALIFDGVMFTYEELDFRSTQLANFLRMNGVKSETIVGLSVHNGLNLLVGILGILRSGGVYLPIDPNYPAKRIEMMLKDASPFLFLTEESLSKKIDLAPYKMVLMDKGFPKDNLSLKEMIQPDQLAYIVYTSGSTGKPKGIMLDHRALSYAALAHLKLHSGRLVSLVCGSLSFDASILVITHTLVSGGTVCVPKNETSMDPEQIIDLINEHSVNYTLCIPSFYAMLLNKSREMPSLRSIDLGGENIPNAIPDIHSRIAPNSILYNIYGPSEYAVGATFAKIYDPITKQRSKITIGKPFQNTQVYILDENLKQAPMNIKGEMFIGGPGLARGYLNNEALSEEKFIWVSFQGQNPIRLYRTGDFGRLLSDGNIELLGRMDHQVKIRGYRIELGEIEYSVCQYPKVNEAVVIVREGPDGDKRLIAYFTAVVKTEIGQELKAHLSQSLPNYMIPSVFVQLESFPRTPNGKIDRDALPDACNEQRNIAAPRSAFEEALAVIWKKILPVDLVGIEDNFFDLGGDSLSIAKVQTLMETELAIKIPVAELLQYPTISQLSRHLHQEASGGISTHPSLAVKKKAAFQRFKARAEK